MGKNSQEDRASPSGATGTPANQPHLLPSHLLPRHNLLRVSTSTANLSGRRPVMFVPFYR